MKKFILLSILLILSTQLFTGCSCEHEWIDATCDSSRICSLCGTTDGEPLGHSWTDATCTASKTCELCAVTEGDPLPHTPGEVQTSTDYVRAITTQTQTCTGCNTVLNSEETVISLVGEDYFHLSPEEFVARLNHIYASIGKTDWSVKLETVPTENADFFMGIISCGDVIYARVIFSTKENNPNTRQLVTLLKEQDKHERIVSHVQVNINYREIASQLNDWTNADISEASDQVSALFDDENLFSDILVPVFRTFGSSLEEPDADSLIRTAYAKTSNFFNYEDIVFTNQCGDFYAEFANVYLANLSYLVNITTSSEYWMENN